MRKKARCTSSGGPRTANPVDPRLPIDIIKLLGNPPELEECIRLEADFNRHIDALLEIGLRFEIPPVRNAATGWLLAWCLAEHFEPDFVTAGKVRTEKGRIHWTNSVRQKLIWDVEREAMRQGESIKTACVALTKQKKGYFTGIARLEAIYHESKKTKKDIGDKWNVPLYELKRIYKSAGLGSLKFKPNHAWRLAFYLAEKHIEGFAYICLSAQPKKRGPKPFWTALRMSRLLVLFQLGIREGATPREIADIAFKRDAMLKGRRSLEKRFYQARERAEALTRSVGNDEIAQLLAEAAKK